MRDRERRARLAARPPTVSRSIKPSTPPSSFKATPERSVSIGTVDRETKELLKRADQNLIALLRAGLDLGFTFARTAGIEASTQNPKDFQRALESVRMALAAVRRFE